MFDKKEIKKEIEKLIKEEKIGEKHWSDSQDIEQLSMELVMAGITLFFWQERNDNSDYWTQTEYYSGELKKTIIWDYDAKDLFESFDEFVDYIYKTNKDIADFESRITFKK